MTTDGLREAAFQTYFVEKTRQPADPENSTFERRFGRPQRNPFLGWNPSPHLISSYVFQGALMDGDFRGLFTSEGFLPGTGYLVSDEDMKGIEISRELVRKVSAVPPVIVGCNTAHRNYFHWVTQALPAIDWCSKRNGPGAVVALPPLNAWQKESIMLLGHDELNIVTIEDCSKLYEFEYLEYCNILSGQASFSLSRTVSDTYSRLRQKICNSPLATRKIYVGRTDAEARRMRNEAELIEHLRKLDFEIVVPGNLSVAEQIQVFGEAALVVGPHGAGMTNIAFCKPGTIVYELLPSHYGNACFCNLARICDLAYWADSFESDGHGLPNLRDWESNTKEIMERLTEIDSVGKYFKIYQETGAAKEVLSRIPLPQYITEVTQQRGVLAGLVKAAFQQAMLDSSEIDPAILELPGMSGRKYRLLINNLIRALGQTSYLEIGTWSGSTLCSAIYGNAVRATAIDNWSQFGAPKEKFFENLRRFCTSGAKVNVIENDFRKVDFAAIGTHAVYLFDGPHEYQDQYDGLCMALPALDQRFVFIVDDWNWKTVRQGTMRAIGDVRLSIDFMLEIRTTLDESHAIPAGEHSDWHNGLFIGVLAK